MKIVLATRNENKLREIRAILPLAGVEWIFARDISNAPEIVEDGATFEANAMKKAAALAVASGLPALADDSGLEVDALDGEPGVRSARYAGDGATDAENVEKLLARMANIHRRKARFRCVLALARPGGPTETFSGACEGAITRAPRGDHGFGYDPVFVPDGSAQTFAEMDPAAKNAMSHRARALDALRQRLKKE
jgi:XTP/dITP diphosphohydrolase